MLLVATALYSALLRLGSSIEHARSSTRNVRNARKKVIYIELYARVGGIKGY